MKPVKEGKTRNGPKGVRGFLGLLTILNLCALTLDSHPFLSYVILQRIDFAGLIASYNSGVSDMVKFDRYCVNTVL